MAQNEPEFDDEIETHLSLLEQRYRQQGMTEEEARLAARRQFGNRTVLEQTRREMSRWFWFATLRQDVKFGVRALRRNPGFTLAAVLTLALGIGANTAIFSVVKAVLIDRLPYRDPGSLVTVAEVPAPGALDVDRSTVWRFRQQSRLVASISAIQDGPFSLLENGRRINIRGLGVSANFFDTLGIRMQRGRPFLQADEHPGEQRELIITHQLWTNHFGGDPHIIGRVLKYAVADLRVVGVLPKEFRSLLRATSSTTPETFRVFDGDPNESCHTCEPVRAIARLRPEVTIGQATAELNTILQRAVREDPEAHRAGARIHLVPMREHVLGRVSAAMWTVLGAVALVLLIACANVANLLLARGAGREYEMAIRAALGAGRLRLIRQLLTESLLLATAGGVLGIAIAWAGTGALVSLAPSDIPRIADTRVDLPVLLFALAVTFATGLLFGLAPAWRAARIATGSRVTAHSKLSDALVVAEIALAFVLVMAAGVVAKSYARLMRVDAGYDPHNVATMTISTSRGEAGLAYFRQVLDRVRAVPGVESAALGSSIPMDYEEESGALFEGRPLPRGVNPPLSDYHSVSNDYFQVMRIRLLRGRTFRDHDTPYSERVAVVNAEAANRFFGGDPIGRHVQLVERGNTWFTIVGVVGNVHQYSLDRDAQPAVYIAQNQGNMRGYYRLLARTNRNAEAMQREITEAAVSVDPMEPVFHIKTLEAYFSGRLAERTFALALLLLLGGLALMLAGVGVYGVISYSVARRTREMGIRIALGASRGDVIAMVMRHGAKLAVAGLAIGFGVSLVVTRALHALLFGVHPNDTVTAIAVGAALALAAVIASLIPARRASNVEPMNALRAE